MPLWMVSSAGSGSVIHWNQPPSSSRFTRSPSATWTSMMIVACGMPSFSARMTPTWPKPWSSDWSPVSTRSNCSSRMAPASASATERRRPRERVGFDVDGAVGAAGQRLAHHLRRAGRAGRADHHLAAVLLLQAQRLFERVGVGLVELEAGACRGSSHGCHSRVRPAMQTAIFICSRGAATRE
jgi:hypothetical protein